MDNYKEMTEDDTFTPIHQQINYEEMPEDLQISDPTMVNWN